MDIENTIKYSMMKGYRAMSVFPLGTHYKDEANMKEKDDHCNSNLDIPFCSSPQHINLEKKQDCFQKCLDNNDQELIIQRLSNIKRIKRNHHMNY